MSEVEQLAKRRMESWIQEEPERFTPTYVKRLLIERHAIREAITNPGGSIIVNQARKAELDALTEYSSIIGNDWHLDLLDAEEAIEVLEPEAREALLLWCDGLSASEAARFYSTKKRKSISKDAVKMRVNRATEKLVEELNNGGDAA